MSPGCSCSPRAHGVMDIFDNDLGDMPEEVLMAVVKDPDGNFVELLGPRR